VIRRPAPLALSVALALGLAAEWASLRRAPLELPASAADMRLAVADFAAGAVILCAGLSLAGRRPGDRVGVMLLVAGLFWFLGTLASSGTATYADLGAAFVTLHRGPLVHALLSAPEGRLPARLDRAVVVAVYAVSAVPPLANTGAALALTAAAVGGVAARRVVRSAGPTRVARLVPLAASIAFAVVLGASAVVAVGGYGPLADRGVLWAYDIVVAAAAAALAADIRLGRWTRSTVTQLVVDLGGGAPLRERLARALGDPSLQVGYVLPGRDGYVDETGAVVALPSSGSSRIVTPLRERDAAVGILVHDASVDDPELLDGVAAAARIVVANMRLQAEVRRQVAELRASRQRLVEAGDAQRRRLEQTIRRGPERALDQAAELLETLPAFRSPTLTGVREELQGARQELAAFARGVHPRALTEGGLSAALRELVRHAPLPVVVDVPAGRLPTPVEETAYFVCAEALANVGKHAHATKVMVRARDVRDHLYLSVDDDGAGGADPLGNGLRGLADRVESLGGRFQVRSAAGTGTRIAAELPYSAQVQR
jgi:hypothetical protein